MDWIIERDWTVFERRQGDREIKRHVEIGEILDWIFEREWVV